jgi:hypothetical protein
VRVLGFYIARAADPLTILADSSIPACEVFGAIRLRQGEGAVRPTIAADQSADLAVGADMRAGLRDRVTQGAEHAGSSDVWEREALVSMTHAPYLGDTPFTPR